MIFKTVVTLAVIGNTISYPTSDFRSPFQPQVPIREQEEELLEPKKQYAFDYGVQDGQTGANYGHRENTNGDTVEGNYRVKLPDGRIQNVNYVVDPENGYQAEVSYDGEAKYDVAEPNHEQSQLHREQISDPMYDVESDYDSEGQYAHHPLIDQHSINMDEDMQYEAAEEGEPDYEVHEAYYETDE